MKKAAAARTPMNVTCRPDSEGCAHAEKLAAAEALALLGDLDNWVYYPDRIEKRFAFKNFKQALAFVKKVGAVAESLNHHPDIHFGWGYAEIVTTTHAVGGLTRNDFALATEIDRVV